jgi:hypothetical protein
MQALLDWHWRFYSELETQRRAIEPDLEDALYRAAKEGFAFERWQRAVKYRYALHPRDAARLQVRYRLIQTVPDLLDQLVDPMWRATPMQFDIPSVSQIFGRLVMQASVEGIIYPSKLNGHPCLAVFPRNFGGSSSFIVLDDEAPKECSLRRIDATNWHECETRVP